MDLFLFYYLQNTLSFKYVSIKERIQFKKPVNITAIIRIQFQKAFLSIYTMQCKEVKTHWMHSTQACNSYIEFGETEDFSNMNRNLH